VRLGSGPCAPIGTLKRLQAAWNTIREGSEGGPTPPGTKGRGQRLDGLDRTWNILLVDDDPDFLHAATRVLKHSSRLKAHVQTAQQAEEALRILDQHLFDVVVADYRMQPDDGAELLRKLHEARPELKRVLLTGFDRDALHTWGVQESEVDLVLDKNDLLTDLDRKLNDFLESNGNGV
jgi:response regulator RpfG family c-di-GMP phosphodiesterase